ncbi:MAG: nucleotidyltransferase domain-containing protein [Methanosarcinales archaeon]
MRTEEADLLREFEFKRYTLNYGEKRRLLKKLKKHLKKIENLEFAYVHGSFVELEEFRDIDVAIWVKDPENAFYYAVRVSMNLEIELKMKIDVHVLNEAPITFRYNVYKRGILLFSKNDRLRLEEEIKISMMYFDLEQLKRYNS